MITESLAAYGAEEAAGRVEPRVAHQARRAVVDWFACVIPGGNLPPATLLTRALGGEGGGGRSALIPEGSRAPMRTAALVNGTAAHTVEFDDIFREAIYHPGCVTIAAALAAAQDRGVDGARFLNAVIVGYEISTRIGEVVAPAHYRFWHTTGTVGTFGAAAAVAAVLGLDKERFSHALATAGTLAAGLQQAFRSDAMSKPIHAGHAADAGALAALAGSEGVTGALDILEGERGFGAAMSEGCDWSAAVDGLGVQYNIEKITVKNHGCCGHTFAAIDGALVLRDQHSIAPEDIEAVEVETYGTAVEVTGKTRPTTPFEAKFSLPFAVSTALVYGSVRRDAFAETRLTDRRINRLLDRFVISEDPALTALFPGRRAARVRIRMADGRSLVHLQPTRRGDPDLPLSDDDLSRRFLELTTPEIGDEPSHELLARLWEVDTLSQEEMFGLGSGLMQARSSLGVR